MGSGGGCVSFKRRIQTRVSDSSEGMYVCMYVCISYRQGISVSIVLQISIYLYKYGVVGIVGGGCCVLRFSTIFIVVYRYAAF